MRVASWIGLAVLALSIGWYWLSSEQAWPNTAAVNLPVQKPPRPLVDLELFPSKDKSAVSAKNTYEGFLAGILDIETVKQRLSGPDVYSLIAKAMVTEVIAHRLGDIEVVRLSVQQYLAAKKLAKLRSPVHHFISKRVPRLEDLCMNTDKAVTLAEKYIKSLSSTDQPQDYYLTDAMNALGMINLRNRRYEKALSEFSKVLEIDPENPFALTHTAICWVKNLVPLHPKTFDYFRRGIEGDETLRTKSIYEVYGSALELVGLYEEAYAIFSDGVSRGYYPNVFYRSQHHVPDGFSSKPFWKLSDLPSHYQRHISLLESNYKVFLEEFNDFVSSGDLRLMHHQTEIPITRGNWSQTVLWNSGIRQPMCKEMPRTCSIIEKIPEATNHLYGQVVFSLLAPGTRIPPHLGPTASRIRLHLGLVCPKEIGIRVANETSTWYEGKVTVFDDAFEHEVWNNATEARLVLVVDLWHPNHKPEERMVDYAEVEEIRDSW